MFTQKLPARAMRGQVVEVRAGATATYGGSMDRDMNDWQVKPTGFSSSIPVTTVTPVANRLSASLNRRSSKVTVRRSRGRGLPPRPPR